MALRIALVAAMIAFIGLAGHWFGAEPIDHISKHAEIDFDNLAAGIHGIERARLARCGETGKVACETAVRTEIAAVLAPLEAEFRTCIAEPGSSWPHHACRDTTKRAIAEAHTRLAAAPAP